MAVINFANREITAKVVYFGASGAGSNTNVRQLFEHVPHVSMSRVHHFGAEQDDERSWFFEYVPLQAKPITGFTVRFRVYSLPGAVSLHTHREEVIRDADGVVFVADARRSQASHNVDMMLALEKLLASQGRELAAIPVVIQVNRTDDPDARKPDDVTFELNPYGFPAIPSVAVEGVGVQETHTEITGAVINRIRDNMAGNEAAITITAVHRADAETSEMVVAHHLEAIAEATAGSLTDETSDPPSDLAELVELPPGMVIEVPFQPRDYAGMRPSKILTHSVDGDRIDIEIVMERLSGGSPRRLTVVLANRPTDTPPVPRSPVSSGQIEVHDMITKDLPDRIEITQPEDTSGPDLPPVLYGVLGVMGGVVFGLLLGYLLV